MRILTSCCLLLLFASAATAQERIPSDRLSKAARMLAAEAKKLADLPQKTDVDTDQPAGIKHDQIAAVFIPEKSLSSDGFAKLGTEVTPVGQLWLLGLVPSVKGDPAPQDKLRRVTIKADDDEKTVSLFLVGASKVDGKVNLVLYGKEKTPLLNASVKPVEHEQETPVDLEAEKVDDESGDLFLYLFGKHVAKIRVRAGE